MLTFRDLDWGDRDRDKRKELKGKTLKECSGQAHDMGTPLFCESGGGNGLFIGEGKQDDKISS